MRLFILAVAFSGIACAQPVSAGLIVGGPLTDASSLVSGAGGSVSNGHWIIGPYIDIHLPAKFALDVDALYSDFSYNATGSLNPVCIVCSIESGSNGNWQFPVLLKYKLLPGPVKPFIEGGLLFSHLTGSDLDVAHSSNYGVTLGAGLEIHALILRLTPEIRYNGFAYHDFVQNSLVQSNRNQVMVLVGIGF
ncbi:MAG TPA: hypothetical protein VMG40_21380 [Bryobacteraceae bacterium]|nr:hypothetical protein [Bryobacteraceae bacterium]